MAWIQSIMFVRHKAFELLMKTIVINLNFMESQDSDQYQWITRYSFEKYINSILILTFDLLFIDIIIK